MSCHLGMQAGMVQARIMPLITGWFHDPTQLPSLSKTHITSHLNLQLHQIINHTIHHLTQEARKPPFPHRSLHQPLNMQDKKPTELQDYQLLLMSLHQQNKKRLLMHQEQQQLLFAREEQRKEMQEQSLMAKQLEQQQQMWAQTIKQERVLSLRNRAAKL